MPLQLADEVAKALVLVLQALPFGALGGKFRAHRQHRGAQAPGVVREIIGQPFERRRHGRFVARFQDRTTASCFIAAHGLFGRPRRGTCTRVQSKWRGRPLLPQRCISCERAAHRTARIDDAGDVAKNVFQVHGVAADGTVTVRRRLRRQEVLPFFAQLPSCLVGLEACRASHYWARELIALGHDARIMPARYVKPYVQRGKSDALDAEAICEAVSRPTMRFAAVKTVEQQSALTLHRTREILVKQETMLANLLRGFNPEFGIVAPLGIRRVGELIAIVRDETDDRLPPEAKVAMTIVADQLADLQRLRDIERAIVHWHRQNEASRRLATIPGVGPITASAVVATVGSVANFKSARHFAAFLGLTPKEHSTGGKQRLGRISKQGDAYIRRLLILGGTALVRYARGPAATGWAARLLQRRPTRVVTVAIANKTARTIWALFARGGIYWQPATLAA
jgi:transposase